MDRSLKRGVTLTEIVFALAIVAIAIISLVTLFVSGLRLVNRSADLERCSEVARQVMEATVELPSVPAGAVAYDGRLGDPRDAATGFPPPPYPSARVDGKDYPVRVELSPSGNLKVVQVRVFYGPQESVWVERYRGP